ncbi:MAG: aminoacyl-tRNA hydrolase [Proteobacteria bacterium]|nr:aminoacyl-tRNA hydrolase [Pseudomonadota bacterium]
MFLIVGLGNPTKKYADNRHNVGFKAVLEIQGRFNFSDFSNKYHGLYTSGTIDGHKVHLLMPQTYMNKSGHSVAECVNFFKIKPENIIVIHDELDFLEAKVKMKIGGSEGGHNGLKSITQCIGSKNYQRIRIGIDHPGDKNQVSDYVLKDIPKQSQEKFEDIYYYLSKVIPILLSEGQAKASNDLSLLLK